ncbi:S1/P1 nuclease [Chitinophaga pinensis]|uniref:S1/P1 nuclease n=1 Tax=Chitinophaga pinensis (strain ATCC 43595 / DSM 2588 / LMG 13176 / NBRC 15968 / NCIMB 11800 / UQM 2034) TaxID=485918 RepID=A0A979GQX0_CHIPD|nr:S1/P1 nuclease [Chitinophaga pinensis]ACU58041.1 S1/P1 nuclease [Chitinophaga pinensis DSM 2588]
MFKKLYHVLLGVILPLIPMTGFAWGVTGHRVVAEIASRHLTPQARKAIIALLGPQSMAMVANWPDFIKSDTTHKYDHTSPWHYLDFPANVDRVHFDEVLKEHTTGENLYAQTEALIKKLKDPATSKADKVFALTFLIHMIGDMHQPLHIGRDEDQGGNKIPVMWFDKQSNLHRVWDEQLIEFQQLSYTEYTQALDTASAAEVRKLQSGSIADWMYDSNQLSNKVYALTHANDKLSYRYNYWFIADLNGQLLKGGLRLAALLNQIYK